MARAIDRGKTWCRLHRHPCAQPRTPICRRGSAGTVRPAVAPPVGHDRLSLPLSYRLELQFGRETFPQSVRVSWTPCALDGERPWFHCPGCSRRVAKLYWGGERLRYRCRQCLGNLPYGSQTKSASGRRLYAAWKLRLRLGSYSVNNAMPRRPLGMQRRTYNRLRVRLEALEASLSRCLRTKTPDYENLSYYVRQ